jgi:hypothetical protein
MLAFLKLGHYVLKNKATRGSSVDKIEMVRLLVVEALCLVDEIQRNSGPAAAACRLVKLPVKKAPRRLKKRVPVRRVESVICPQNLYGFGVEVVDLELAE